MPDVSEMLRALDALRPRHPLEDEGWTYFDPPGKFAPELWDQLLGTLGPENYQILVMSTGADKDGLPWARGQLMVSPNGMANLQRWLKQDE